MTEENPNVKQQFHDLSNFFSYFSMIPNIIYKLGLSPQEIGLYCFMKSIAGESKTNKEAGCWMSPNKICESLNISLPTFRKLRDGLCRHFDIINGPLITVTHRFNNNGACQTTLIQIIDIWTQNNSYDFRKKTNDETDGSGVENNFPGGGKNLSGGWKKSFHKEKQSNKNQCEEVNDINDNQTSRVSKSKSDIDVTDDIDPFSKERLRCSKSEQGVDQKKIGEVCDNQNVIDDIDPFSKGGSLNGPKKYLNDKAQINFFDELKKKNIDTDDETLCYWIKTYTKEKIIGAYKSAIKHKANSIGAYMGGLLKKEFKHESKNVITCIEIARKFVNAKPESFHFGFDDETYEYWYDVGSGEICDTFESMHPETFAKLLSDKLRLWEGR